MNNSSMLIEFKKNKTELNTTNIYKINRRVKEKLPLEAYVPPENHEQ